jgi:hypothetical protein
MPKAATMSMPKLTGKQLGGMFLVFLAIHMVVIYFANKWYPESVVLGNHFFSPMTGLLYAMIPFTLLTVAAVPIVEHLTDTTKWKMTDWHWPVLYLVVNASGLWFLARFAEWLGMGLSSWMVVVVLAVIMDILQGFAWMTLVAGKKK